jgi:hypothetical protein
MMRKSGNLTAVSTRNPSQERKGCFVLPNFQVRVRMIKVLLADVNLTTALPELCSCSGPSCCRNRKIPVENRFPCSLLAGDRR